MSTFRPNDVLSAEEMRALRRPSTVRGSLAVAFDWAVIAGSLAACAVWPHPLTVAAALVVIGGRQLALAILMHEAAHRTLMASRGLNDVVGRWLCAAPVWTDLERYRTHHLSHHTRTGTPDDPDLCLVEPFPTTRAGMLRKAARDLSGLTGLKRIVATLAMDFELLTYTASGGARRVERPEPRRLARGLARTGPFLLINGLLLALLIGLGHGWLFAVWACAWLTTFSLFLRIRSIAEHACTELGSDPLRNTRTTHAHLLARATVAPHRVNYHLEHHLLMTVPFFRLPGLHRILAERGVLPPSSVAPGYRHVLKLAIDSG